MKRILTLILLLALMLLAACNRASGNQAIPTLIAFPTVTATIEADFESQAETIIETEAPIETEEIVASPGATEEATPEKPTYVLSDFDDASLWRIISNVSVNGYSCEQRSCAIDITYNNGELLRVVATDNGWHTVLALDSTLVYVEEQFTIFVQILDTETLATDTATPTQTAQVLTVSNPTLAPSGQSTTGNPTGGSSTIINVPAAAPNTGNNNNNNAGTGNNPQQPVTNPSPTVRPTITADPNFTPFLPFGDKPPGATVYPSPVGPGAVGGNTSAGGAPPGYVTPDFSNPPPPPPNPPTGN